MRYRAFGAKQASVIGFGSSNFGGDCPEGLAHELLDAFKSIGGNFIDTARVYGDFAHKICGGSEKVIGHWLDRQNDRDSFFLSTKGGHPELDHMHTGRLSRAEICSDMHESLDALHTDYVDIYWLHRDDLSRPVGEIMETLNGLVEAGETRLIGVSNWTAARIEEANAYADAHGLVKLFANQPRFSLAEQILVEDDTLIAMDADMWRMHQRTGMTVVCFSATAKGFYAKLDAAGIDGLSDKARRRYYCPRNMEIYDRLKQVQAQTGYSMHALSAAWLTCQDVPTWPLCGASSVSQVLQLAEASDAVITPEQRDYLFKF